MFVFHYENNLRIAIKITKAKIVTINSPLGDKYIGQA